MEALVRALVAVRGGPGRGLEGDYSRLSYLLTASTESGSTARNPSARISTARHFF
jgi:hypothetical protein